MILLAIQTALNITGAKVMGRVAQFGVYIEIIGTLGIAIILAIHGFNHGLGFLFSTQDAQHAAHNALGLDFKGNWLTGAALIAVLAPVYIFYGFESAGDISEETKDPGRSGAEGDAVGADLGRDRLVHPDRGAAARDAEDGPRRCDRQGRRRAVHPLDAAELAAGLPPARDHLRVLLVRHLRAGSGQPPGLLLRP